MSSRPASSISTKSSKVKRSYTWIFTTFYIFKVSIKSLQSMSFMLIWLFEIITWVNYILSIPQSCSLSKVYDIKFQTKNQRMWNVIITDFSLSASIIQAWNESETEASTPRSAINDDDDFLLIGVDEPEKGCWHR